MELYIHFGIYKAGSSYLQYICANTRSHLQKHGYFYPYSKEDSKMKAGLISKGNADGLELALKNEDNKSLKSILGNWLIESKKSNCDKILISAEAMVHQLAKSKQLGLLEQIALAIGIQKVHAMGFFRDLADHALSTYKHRAKSGKIKDFEKWVSYEYETPELLINLSSTRKKFIEINWTFRKFQKDSKFLEDAFFIDWLKIDKPIFDKKPTVNESISISEIQLMKQLESVYPNVMEFFFDPLKKLPSDLKANNKELDNFHLYKATSLLNGKWQDCESINEFFENGESIQLGNYENQEKVMPSTCIFTTEQLQLIANSLLFLNSTKGRLLQWRRKIVALSPKYFIKKLMR